MSLDIRQALQAGYDGLTSTAGYNVFSVLLVFYVAYDAVRQSFRQQLLATAPGVLPPPGFTPPFDIDMLAFELPLSVLVALTVAAVISHERFGSGPSSSSPRVRSRNYRNGRVSSWQSGAGSRCSSTVSGRPS